MNNRTDILKIKQLLLNDDEANWTLGVIMMINENVTVDKLINELYPDETDVYIRELWSGVESRFYKGYCGYTSCSYELLKIKRSSHYRLLILYNKIKNELNEIK